jgi:hypothetical protein
MPTVDGIAYGYPDNMTERQWSNYVTGHDPDNRRRVYPHRPAYNLEQAAMHAKLWRESRWGSRAVPPLTEAQRDAVEALRETLDEPGQQLLDAMFGGAA